MRYLTQIAIDKSSMAFSLAPMVILGIPNSSIFLLIYFVNHNFILLGTNKVVVVAAAAIKVLRQSLLRERLHTKGSLL